MAKSARVSRKFSWRWKPLRCSTHSGHCDNMQNTLSDHHRMYKLMCSRRETNLCVCVCVWSEDEQSGAMLPRLLFWWRCKWTATSAHSAPYLAVCFPRVRVGCFREAEERALRMTCTSLLWAIRSRLFMPLCFLAPSAIPLPASPALQIPPTSLPFFGICNIPLTFVIFLMWCAFILGLVDEHIFQFLLHLINVPLLLLLLLLMMMMMMMWWWSSSYRVSAFMSQSLFSVPAHNPLPKPFMLLDTRKDPFPYADRKQRRRRNNAETTNSLSFEPTIPVPTLYRTYNVISIFMNKSIIVQL